MFKASGYKDTSAKILFFVCACLSVVAVFGIIGFILYASVPAFRQIGFFNFLFGTIWAPDIYDPDSPASDPALPEPSGLDIQPDWLFASP